MNRKEILNEMAELKERLNSLEKMYNSLTPPNKRWRADRGNTYYFINSDGRVFFENDYNLSVDKSRYAFGNYFETREEAEFEVERLKVIAELKDLAIPVNNFDWDNNDERKYTIVLESGEVMADYYLKCQNCELYFSTKEVAENAIEAVGEDRIIKYYFRKGDKNENSD